MNLAGTEISSYKYVSEAGDSTYDFDQDGVLLSIVARNGNIQRLTYSAGESNDTAIARYPADSPVCQNMQNEFVLPKGRLLCVTDQFDGQLNFKHDATGRVVEIKDPSNQSYLYEYDGLSGGCSAEVSNSAACRANNLTKVTYPNQKSETYFYNERTHINDGNTCAGLPPVANGFGPFPTKLTSIVDENGVRFLNWNYDCQQRAVMSEKSGGVEKVTLAYSPISSTLERTTTVTHSMGTVAIPVSTVRSITAKFIKGVATNTAVDHPCVECGPYKERTYNLSGSLATTTDFNNAVTKYAFNSNNLEVERTEAFGTAHARKTSTEWNALRLPLKIAAPKRLTTFQYDIQGNVLTRTEQATTDLTGAAAFTATLTGKPRKWTHTYYDNGQPRNVTGPRTDVVDVTDYIYDTKGNLTTIKNALGHQTQFSQYDANGRVGRIEAPNGVVTTLLYTPRGWLDNVTVTAGGVSRTTSYEYDGVGQMTLVRMPGGATMTYVYDDARRLKSITDLLGNSITYTLDLRGNRIAEKVTDPSGILTRQVAREYDVLNRLKTQTGAAE